MNSQYEPCNLNDSVILFRSNFTESADCDVLFDDILPTVKKYIFALYLSLMYLCSLEDKIIV